MYRYTWEAHHDDGSSITRWDSEARERQPDPWRTRQFHLYSMSDPKTDAVHLFIPKGAWFYYRVRRSGVYVIGWQWPDDEHGVYLFLLPRGGVEMGCEPNHLTRYERD